jgi:hypothetical protein
VRYVLTLTLSIYMDRSYRTPTTNITVGEAFVALSSSDSDSSNDDSDDSGSR